MSTYDLFVGGRLEGLTALSGGTGLSTDAYDNTYSDCNVLTPQGASFEHGFYDTSGNATAVTAGNYAMAHAEVQLQQGNISGPIAAMLDSTGRKVVACYGDGNGNFYLAQNTNPTGETWAQLGTGTVYRPFNGGLGTIDLQVVVDASGAHTALLACNGNAVQSHTFTDTAVASGGVSGMWYGCLYNGWAAWSQLYARANGSTIGAHVKTVRATGAGTYSAWTGTYTDVNEQFTNDSTVNQSTNVGDKQSYPMANVTVPTGYTISGVWHWLRAKNDGGSPDNIKSLILSSGTEAASGDLPGLGLTFNGTFHRYDTDPHTSAAWTQAGFNAPVELGFQSDT